MASACLWRSSGRSMVVRIGRILHHLIKMLRTRMVASRCCSVEEKGRRSSFDFLVVRARPEALPGPAFPLPGHLPEGELVPARRHEGRLHPLAHRPGGLGGETVDQVSTPIGEGGELL